MKPFKFNRHCQTLKSDNPIIDDLPVLPMRYTDIGAVMVTCWKLSFGDLLRILWTRRIYMTIVGNRWPATMLTADPFQVGLDQIQDSDYLLDKQEAAIE